MAQKPSIPKGTRDFLPLQMQGRKYIFETAEKVFKKFGFLNLLSYIKVKGYIKCFGSSKIINNYNTLLIV